MRNILVGLAVGVIVGGSFGGRALAEPPPGASVCLSVPPIMGPGRVTEFMDNNIAAGRVRFVATAQMLCAW